MRPADNGGNVFQFPRPTSPDDFPPTSPIEAFFLVLLVAALLFGLTLTILPRAWSDTVLKIVFPFLKRHQD